MSRLAFFLTVFLFCGNLLAASLPDIYDTKSDGKKLIANALVTAKKENKHVLLQFGANWCSSCHLLHDLFAKNTPIREKLASSYILLLLDIDQTHNEDVNLRYGKPTLRGLPVLVVLDAEGNQIHTQETGAFEKDKDYDPAKVLAFLNKW